MIAKCLFCNIILYLAWERIYYVILITDHFYMCFFCWYSPLASLGEHSDACVLPLLFSSSYMMDNAANVEMNVGSSDSSSIGDAVSGRGHHLPDDDDDDDLFYIPERRPSLDLGSNLMDISQWWCLLFSSIFTHWAACSTMWIILWRHEKDFKSMTISVICFLSINVLPNNEIINIML